VHLLLTKAVAGKVWRHVFQGHAMLSHEQVSQDQYTNTHTHTHTRHALSRAGRPLFSLDEASIKPLLSPY
jgi:hypothetical protein